MAVTRGKRSARKAHNETHGKFRDMKNVGEAFERLIYASWIVCNYLRENDGDEDGGLSTG